jgi:hypothetical protein
VVERIDEIIRRFKDAKESFLENNCYYIGLRSLVSFLIQQPPERKTPLYVKESPFSDTEIRPSDFGCPEDSLVVTFLFSSEQRAAVKTARVIHLQEGGNFST